MNYLISKPIHELVLRKKIVLSLNHLIALAFSMNLTLKSYIDWVESWKLNPQDVVNHYLTKAKEKNSEYFSFIRFHEDYIKNNLEEFAKKPLHGAPIGIKDIILTQWEISSCGSKLLEDYISPYSATCFLNLEKNGWMMIGKTNMDEFAMWSSTESSYFGKTINPYGSHRVPWWSSWWSAVAVASDSCIAALWTDTWWSIRQPAALCWIVGMKPTYWMVSRYWVQSMASSLDQVGVLTKTVEDAEILLKSIAWFDSQDSQSNPLADKFLKTNDYWLSTKLKVCLPKEVLAEWIDLKVKNKFLETIEILRWKWIKIDEISLPILAYSLPMYYTIMPAEVSTNLARFDGIKFGFQENTIGHESIIKYYEKIRSEGFGDEAKRRILLWTFVLSSAHYEWYYLKAQQARNKLKSDFDKLFASYDIILMPTSPELAWKIWEKVDDPIKMYLSDMYTISANMWWLPAMSLPIWNVSDHWEDLPVWMQLMAQRWNENKIFQFAKFIENAINKK